MPTEAQRRTDTAWVIDPARSTVGFTITHFKVATVKGRFSAFAGALVTDERGGLRATGIVHAGTLETGNPLRDRRLRGAEFLDTCRHPAICFSSQDVEQLAAGELRITGDLTIKDTTRRVELRARIGAATDDRLELDVTGRLSRAEFGIDSLELKAAGVSDAVTFVAGLSLDRQVGTHGLRVAGAGVAVARPEP